MIPFISSFDNLLTVCKRWIMSLRGKSTPFVRVHGFDRFVAKHADARRALVSFSPTTLWQDASHGRGRFFNSAGAALAMAQGLNELGFLVDMVHYKDQTFVPEKPYDLFVGHGNFNYQTISSRLPQQAKKVYYSTGCYWKKFIEQSNRRYEDFCARRGVKAGAGFTRGIIDEEFSTVDPDLLICLGKETAKTYAPIAKRVVPINNAAYLDLPIDSTPKNWRTIRRNYLYYGSTGNIQKGLDLLIEAFAAERDHHLYIYGPLEPEILRYYCDELQSPNIHYAHHLRFFPERFLRMMNQCAFTILPGFNSGQSTALIGALGYGLIPVINTEADVDVKDRVFIEDNTVEAIRSALRQGSAVSELWLEQARVEAIQYFRTYHHPEAFKLTFMRAIESLC